MCCNAVVVGMRYTNGSGLHLVCLSSHAALGRALPTTPACPTQGSSTKCCALQQGPDTERATLAHACEFYEAFLQYFTIGTGCPRNNRSALTEEPALDIVCIMCSCMHPQGVGLIQVPWIVVQMHCNRLAATQPILPLALSQNAVTLRGKDTPFSARSPGARDCT